MKIYKLQIFGHADSCFDDVPMEKFEDRAGMWMNIFVDLPFYCHGIVQGWRFKVYIAGSVFIDIWRPIGESRYELVSTN